METQKLPITIVYTTVHNPGTDQHLHEIAKNYFLSKGVVLNDDNTIDV